MPIFNQSNRHVVRKYRISRRQVPEGPQIRINVPREASLQSQSNRHVVRKYRISRRQVPEGRPRIARHVSAGNPGNRKIRFKSRRDARPSQSALANIKQIAGIRMRHATGTRAPALIRRFDEVKEAETVCEEAKEAVGYVGAREVTHGCIFAIWKFRHVVRKCRISRRQVPEGRPRIARHVSAGNAAGNPAVAWFEGADFGTSR